MNLHKQCDKKMSSLQNVLNKIRMSVPEPGSIEDVLLQQCEITLPCTDAKYPREAMHVFAQNKYCEEWNNFMLNTLSGDITTCVAQDSKKDNMTKASRY